MRWMMNAKEGKDHTEKLLKRCFYFWEREREEKGKFIYNDTWILCVGVINNCYELVEFKNEFWLPFKLAFITCKLVGQKAVEKKVYLQRFSPLIKTF